jgi:hypothetical protein
MLQINVVIFILSLGGGSSSFAMNPQQWQQQQSPKNNIGK